MDPFQNTEQANVSMLSACPNSLNAAISKTSIYLPVCHLQYTDSSLLILSLCICSSGELLLCVKSKNRQILDFFEPGAGHVLNSISVSIKLVLVKFPSEYGTAKPK